MSTTNGTVNIQARAAQHMVREVASAHNTWSITADHVHDLDDVKSPGYLWNAWVSKRVRPGDVVEIIGDRYLFYVRLFVVGEDANTQSVLFNIMEEHDWRRTKQKVNDIRSAKARYINKTLRWGVFRGDEKLEHNLESQDAAEEWIRNEIEKHDRLAAEAA